MQLFAVPGTGCHVGKLSSANSQNDKEMCKKNNNFRGFSGFALRVFKGFLHDHQSYPYIKCSY